MKRDMELMRKILFEIEDQYQAGEGSIFNLSVEGYDLKDVAEHCRLLYQAELIGDYKAEYANGEIYFFGITNLTNKGYEYLELIRNEDVWQKTNETIKEKKLPETINNFSKVAGTFVGAILSQLLDK